MFYLFERWKQQAGIRQEDLFDRLVVSDYLYLKDRLFAEKTLNEEELELYNRFSAALGESTPTPDAIIMLTAPIKTLIKRIARRQAPGEEVIKSAYLEDLRDRYDKLWASWTACPVIYLDNTELNYVDDPAARRQIIDKVMRVLSGDESPGSDPDREEQIALF